LIFFECIIAKKDTPEGSGRYKRNVLIKINATMKYVK